MDTSNERKLPVVVLVVGMAGSGKTTLMHRLNLFMLANNKRGYYINLDPATRSCPFSANVDIRDTVNYKEVMKQYGLGPNGGILTSLNLFATRFDQVIGLLEKRAESLDYIFVDTPGQIEAFTWSAGGQLMTELLGASFPTAILYIVDTPRCASPTTFMSSMLYCCSILYKTRLPLICAFNKVDAVACEFALEWMRNFESYLEAVDADSDSRAGSGAHEQYMSGLNRSLALALEDFYRNVRAVGVSAATGEGCDELFATLQAVPEDYRNTYLPDILKKKAAREKVEGERVATDLSRLTQDLKLDKAENINGESPMNT